MDLENVIPRRTWTEGGRRAEPVLSVRHPASAHYSYETEREAPRDHISRRRTPLVSYCVTSRKMMPITPAPNTMLMTA